MTGRTFESGASRNTDEGKLDFEAFISPNALRAFAEYMDENAWLDDERRPGDNWQKGIPTEAYVKSLWRHFFDVWALHRGVPTLDAPDMKRALGGVLFNAFGLLHELTKPTAAHGWTRCGARGFVPVDDDFEPGQCIHEMGHGAHIAHVYETPEGAAEATGSDEGSADLSQSTTPARVTCPRCFGAGFHDAPFRQGTQRVRCALCLGAGECSRLRAAGVIER